MSFFSSILGEENGFFLQLPSMSLVAGEAVGTPQTPSLPSRAETCCLPRRELWMLFLFLVASFVWEHLQHPHFRAALSSGKTKGYGQLWGGERWTLVAALCFLGCSLHALML